MFRLPFRRLVLSASIAATVVSPAAWGQQRVQLEDIDLSRLDQRYRTSSQVAAPPPPPENIEEDLIAITLRSDPEFGADLTESEIDLIKRKRKALIRYLYEQEQLEDIREEMNSRARQDRLEATVQEQYPLTPEDIKELRRLKLRVDQASNAPIVEDVETHIRTVDLDIESSDPIKLEVSRGFASSMVFYDETGRPWPIKGDIIGDESAFKSRIVGEHSHIAVFEITREFAESNALINLSGLPVPLVVRLMGREGSVDSRLSVRIPRLGPNAEAGPVNMPKGIDNAPDEILEMLNGGQLSVGKAYELSGAPGSVYFYNGALYIRSKAKLLSPPINPPLSMELQSPTGYNVYRIPPVTQLLFTLNGDLLSAQVKPKSLVEIPKTPSIFNVNSEK